MTVKYLPYANSFDEAQAVPQAFMTVLVSLPWPRWEELLSYVPEGTLLRELRRQALDEASRPEKNQPGTEGGARRARCEVVPRKARPVAVNGVQGESEGIRPRRIPLVDRPRTNRVHCPGPVWRSEECFLTDDN